MSRSSIESLKIKAKLLQKAKMKAGKEFALKDAYALLAKAASFSSWKEMKDSYELSDIFNPPHWSGQWKIWFATRNEALECLKNHAGFLLPYRDQFFICDKDYLNALGVSADDEDVRKIGRDWTRPLDEEAFLRLIEKIKRKKK